MDRYTKQLGNTVKEVKKKKESLMAAYRGYKIKIKKSEVLRAGSDVYRPAWFAFDYMDGFLESIYQCKQFMNTEDDETSITCEHDTEATNPLAETEISIDSSSQEEPSASTSRRRRHSPAGLQQEKQQMDQAFQMLRAATQKQYIQEDEECNIFGRLVAIKLRKLPENRRDLLMVRINELIYSEAYDCNRPGSLSSVSPYTHVPSPI